MQRVTRKNEKAYADERGNRRNCDRKRITYNAPTEKNEKAYANERGNLRNCDRKRITYNAPAEKNEREYANQCDSGRTTTANVLHATRRPTKKKSMGQ